MTIIISLLTFISTFCGGIFALKFKNKTHLIFGFTAGVILAVVSFDIFPEIIEMTNKLQIDPKIPMTALVVGFLIFHVLEKSILINHSHEKQYANHKHPSVGIISAFALIGHSFLDGLGIGLAFQVSPQIGVLLAIAVIAHDFSDGLNTVSLMILNKNSIKSTIIFLILDSIAPIIGVICGQIFHLSSNILLIYLGFFAGFLLYIGVSDILPEAHSNNSSYTTILLTITGVILIYFVTAIV